MFDRVSYMREYGKRRHETNFYAYLWLREDGTPYYVGKGRGTRAWRNDHNVKMPDRARIVVQEFESEAEAFVAEQFLIAYYGRKDLGTGCLRNITNGGEGISGHRHSEAQKVRWSIMRRLKVCKRGHSLDGTNVYERIRDGKLHRSCVACQRLRDKACVERNLCHN